MPSSRTPTPQHRGERDRRSRRACPAPLRAEGLGRGDTHGGRLHGLATGAAGLPAGAPGELPAAVPLQQRLVSSNEVWLVVEGNSVTVEFVAEAGTKPDSTGTSRRRSRRSQGRRHDARLRRASRRLNGMAAELVSSQFANAIGIAVDDAIIAAPAQVKRPGSATRWGHLDGRRRARRQGLMDSVLEAAGRLAEDFITPDTLVVHPRDFVSLGSRPTRGPLPVRPRLDRSARRRGITVVADANMPDNLGVGPTRRRWSRGNLPRPAPSSSRTPLVLEASRDAGWVTTRPSLACRAVRLRGRAPVRIRGLRHRAVGEGGNHDG